MPSSSFPPLPGTLPTEQQIQTYLDIEKQLNEIAKILRVFEEEERSRDEADANCKISSQKNGYTLMFTMEGTLVKR